MKSLTLIFSFLVSGFAFAAAKPVDLNGLWAGRGTYFDSLAPGNSQCNLRFKFSQGANEFHFEHGSYDCGGSKTKKYPALDLKIGGTVVYLNSNAIGTIDDKRLHLILAEGNQQTELNIIMNRNSVMYQERIIFTGSPRTVFVTGSLKKQAL